MKACFLVRTYFRLDVRKAAAKQCSADARRRLHGFETAVDPRQLRGNESQERTIQQSIGLENNIGEIGRLGCAVNALQSHARQMEGRPEVSTWNQDTPDFSQSCRQAHVRYGHARNHQIERRSGKRQQRSFAGNERHLTLKGDQIRTELRIRKPLLAKDGPVAAAQIQRASDTESGSRKLRMERSKKPRCS